MINPYLCYIFSFVMALGLYSLNWSEWYPRLSISLILFLLGTISLHGIMGYFWRKKMYTPVTIVNEDRNPIRITTFIYALWVVEFLHAGGIPFFKILSSQPFNYELFGVPTFHVFVVTFSSFYTIYLFHLYLSSRRKIILLLYLLNLAAAILIYNRGMFLFNLSAGCILLLFSLKKITFRILYAVPIMLGLLFLFGVMGTIRESKQENEKYDNAIFLYKGGARDSFRQSLIPKEFFWTYIYVSSPLANLQHHVNTYSVKTISVGRVFEMINNEVLPDFISKRINSFLHLQREDENTVDWPFNVSTIYSRAFSYLGWWGMVSMALLIVTLPWCYAKILSPESPFFLTGQAILAALFLFMAFDNTVRFTGLSFQLVYPVLFTVLKNRRLFNLIN